MKIQVNKDIALNISGLLSINDCVIVPGFGAFLADSKSSVLDFQKDYFTPPRRVVSFNSDLIENDGILIHSLAKSKLISYAEAKLMIQEEVAKINYYLEEGNSVDFESLGFFIKDSMGYINFNLYSNPLLFPEGYGLSAFYLPKVRQSVVQDIQSKTYKVSNRLRKAAIYTPVVLLLALVPYQMRDQGTNWIAKSSLNPFADFFQESIRVKNIQVDPAKIADWTLENDFMESAHIQMKEAIVDYQELNAEKVYHIIGASYNTLYSANRFKRFLERKGYTSEVFRASKNRFRVSYASFASEERAMEFLDKVRQDINPDAWLLKD